MVGELTGSNTVWTENHIDLKLRVGYSVGQALIFGFGGYSTATIYEDLNTEPMPVSGINYGVGMDYQLNDRFFVGADYTIRDLSGDFNQNIFPDYTAEGPVSSVSLRLGARF